MNHQIPHTSTEQKILGLVPQLVKLGRTANPSAIGDAILPVAWDFGVLWKKWETQPPSITLECCMNTEQVCRPIATLQRHT